MTSEQPKVFQCGCCNSNCTLSLDKARNTPSIINCAFDKSVLTHHNGINWKPRPHPASAQETIGDREDRELNIRIAGFEEGYAQGKAEAARKAREDVLNELGVLHGEDAKRFHENMNSPPDPSPEAKEIYRRARAIADRLVMGCWYFDHNTCPMPHPREHESQQAGEP